MKKRALFLFGDGVEELELIAPVDLLRRAGAEVTMATMGEGIHVQSRGGIVFHADTSFAEIYINDFDIIVIPGGPGVIELRRKGLIVQALANFHRSGKPIAAICAATLLLKDAGILDGKKFTSHDSCWQELTTSIKDQAVVIDGDLITSQGAGTAVVFGLALVEKLCGREAAISVSRQIMV
jgi:4-methyl-5(b-hydroxyethyl)-thiazole monophosphate biosynthesis